MSIRALFFDFDGTLWDSEVAGFESWSEIYEDHGLEFPIEIYATRLGTMGGIDPIEALERRVGHPLDRAAISERHRSRKLELLIGLGPRPGVEDYLREARQAGLALGVVSTDDLDWVMSGLRRLELEDQALARSGGGRRDRRHAERDPRSQAGRAVLPRGTARGLGASGSEPRRSRDQLPRRAPTL